MPSASSLMATLLKLCSGCPASPLPAIRVKAASSSFVGLDSSLNAITINGARVPSPEKDTRSVALDVIPSDLLESLEVVKALRPDLDADAVGGLVEIKPLIAFDRGQQSFSARVEASHNDLTGETSPKVSGTATKVFSVGDGVDNFGAAFAISYFDRQFGSENLETDGGWPLTETPAGNEIPAIEEGEQRDYTITRERLGVTLNFDYRPTDTDSYFLRTLYSEFSDDEIRLRNEYKFDEGDITSLDAVSGVFEGAELEKSSKDRFEEQTITSFVLGGENARGPWTFNYDLAYSKSDEDEPNRIDATFVGDADLAYDATDNRRVLFTGLDDAAFDPGNFELDEIVVEDNFTEDEETAVRLDVQFDTLFGDNPGLLEVWRQAAQSRQGERPERGGL